MNKIKAFGKDAMGIGIAGIGIASMTGLGDDNTDAALGKLGKGLGGISNVTVMKHTMGILEDVMPKKKKW